MKRALDVVVAALALVLLSPLLLIVAIVIRLDSGKPVFFSQIRIGKDFKPFALHKFRTMAQGSGPRITVGNDRRVTRAGGVLRRFKIDELPQLYNVLRGDMSLVGPRPELPEWVAQHRSDFGIILSLRPGITDPASLKYRNEAALLAAQGDPEKFYAEVILPDKIAMAKQYVDDRSLQLDIQLLFRTVGAVTADPGGHPLPR